jgi:putative endonuclease
MSGLVSYRKGLHAEEAVEQVYTRAGREICARRWRGVSGEVDLILRDGAEIIFVEVKASRTHEEAALKLGPAQMARLCASAAEFIGGEPAGQLTPCRFDLALVDGQGRVQILENAFAA